LDPINARRIARQADTAVAAARRNSPRTPFALAPRRRRAIDAGDDKFPNFLASGSLRARLDAVWSFPYGGIWRDCFGPVVSFAC